MAAKYLIHHFSLGITGRKVILTKSLVMSGIENSENALI
jgi:hypothetical protein